MDEWSERTDIRPESTTHPILSKRSKQKINQMLKENILWSKMLNPVNGRVVTEPTVLGIIVLAAIGFVLIGAVVVLGAVLGAVL